MPHHAKPLSQDHIGKQVFVFYNLHTHRWSVRHKGLVIGHAEALRLDNVTLKVSEAGRQRVIREQRKNVHAGITGTLSAIGVELPEGGNAVTYNPYKYRSFVMADSGAPVHTADVAWMVNRKVVVAGNLA